MKTKKFLTFAFALCMAAALNACGGKETAETSSEGEQAVTQVEATDSENIIASGDCGDQGDNVIWVLDKNWTLTISGEGRMADYNYDNPAPWETYYKEAFKPETDGIEHLIIQDGVTYLGNSAFSNMGRGEKCTADIANSVTEIGKSTFINWYVDAFTLPNNIIKIGENAFAGSHFTSIVIPDSVTIIEDRAFAKCRYLTDITLSKNLKELNLYAFTDCLNLNTFVIPEGVEKITGGFGIGGTGGVNEIYIPASVTSIYDDMYNTLGFSTVLIHTPAGSFMEQYAIEHNLTYDNNY